jgi:NADPH:quinone reductase-like Zn-dependent oxidoreductase
MKAIVYYSYGSPDVLEYGDVERPEPADDQVLVKIRFSSVNPYDWHFLRGTPTFIRLFTGIVKPKSPRLGADVAGEVAAIGSRVTRFKPGDPVFGTCRGSFAEFACAPEKNLALKPAGITFEQAAALPIAGITALQGLRDCGRLQSGQSVLINGAAGGVGTFAVQIAKHFGARVTGVCSLRNVEMVRSIGADAVIDYTQEDFTQLPERHDVLFDLVGNRPLSAMRRALRPRGTYVGCGGGGPERGSGELLAARAGRFLSAPFVRQKLTGVLAKINPRDLEVLGELVRSEKVTPVFDRTFPLAETAQAIRYVEQGHARGKVIVSIA